MTNDNRHASAVDELSERFWESILELPEIYINGGRRGLLVKLKSADLVRALELSLVDVALS